MTRTEYETKTRNLRKEAYRLYKAGYSRQEIADATGYSKSYVERIIYAINGPAERKALSETDREQILKLRGEGKTIQKIAQTVGYSMSTVQKCLKDQRETEEKEQPEEFPSKFTMATRKPQIKRTVINGKKYADVSEFYLGI